MRVVEVRGDDASEHEKNDLVPPRRGERVRGVPERTNASAGDALGGRAPRTSACSIKSCFVRWIGADAGRRSGRDTSVTWRTAT